MSHLSSCWREVLVTPCYDTRDEHCWFRWAAGFPVLIILIFFFFGIRTVWVFLHNPHPTRFNSRRVSSPSLGFLFGRRRIAAPRAARLVPRNKACPRGVSTDRSIGLASAPCGAALPAGAPRQGLCEEPGLPAASRPVWARRAALSERWGS